MNDNPPDDVLGAQRRQMLDGLRERQRECAARRFAERGEARKATDALGRQGLFLAVDGAQRVADRAARKRGQPRADAGLVEAAARVVAEPARSVTAAFERLIGRNDLLPVAYLERGTRAAAAVGRIVITDGAGRELAYGTGFLVAPGVVLTNHHVLPDAATAADSIIQFNYEADIDGKMEQVRTARFDAARYLSSETLDFALAAITVEQGELPQQVFALIGSPAKIVHNEPVTIIQHPGAQPKQVALRDNKLLDVLPDFLHYSTDTEAGASGSPVCNDQWEVVALHHAGVPAPDGGDNWIANEGVRISRIVAWLKQQDALPEPVRAMVDLVLGQDSGAPAPVVPGPPEAVPVRPAPRPDATVQQSLAASSAPARLEVGVGDYVAEVSVNLRPARPEGLLTGLLRGGERRPLPGFISQLEAGDVLLYSGTGILSEGIKFFTKSDVSHAALYLGGQAGMIGEAVDAGVVPRPPSTSFPGHEWVVVHRLPTRRDMAPVLQRADFYLGQGLRYAYPQLVLLGILLLVKRVRPSGVLGKMLQAVFIAAADTLNRYVESGRDLMICSEFVYRCFDEAPPAADGPYRLEVPWVAREAVAADTLAPAVERGSIADVLMREREQASIGFQQAAESLSMQLPLNQQALQAQAESLLAEHMAEERWGRPYKLPPPQSLLDPPVVAAVARFAMALQAARLHEAGRAPEQAWPAAAAPALEAGSLPPALQSLLRTPADFVTPADLRASPSLVEAGRIF